MTIFLYTLAVTITILLPLTLAILFRRRIAVPWWFFLIGVVTFIGSQIYHIPLNNWLTDLGVIGTIEKDAPNLIGTAIILGLSAGLSESIARAIGYALLFRKKKADQLSDAVFIGLGHGGIEAMLFGGVILAASAGALWGLRTADLSSMEMTSAQLAQVQQQLLDFEKPIFIFVPLVERMIAMTLHVVLSMFVWQAFSKRNPLYFVVGVLIHATFDATAVYASVNLSSIWMIEGLLFVMLLPPAWIAWRWWAKWDERPYHTVIPFIKELRLFAVALRKELWQQWHTKRVIVVFAVFILFGLGSPLLANFTPQLLNSIEGAEQFADLIPTPTNVDALTQYIKNITQFGFIIAVLLGMGAVAGEKDKGSAAIILSKPLPRWAFLLSKFTAQATVYAGAFLLSALGAAYYTSLLFEPWALGAFMFGNLLLLVWLLVFSAVTLVGSTLTNSTGAAAGIGLAGAILLLIVGSLPTWVSFTPSGLIAWASQLGLDTAVSPLPGALAANLVLILLLLVTAVAAFETQEL
ncbi:MAG: YhfC family intramembrane metalloprotease [Chloroflexi bacterium]|nr:YhfC family intramembrane metalloprotease [Chloroflexota bacterium]